MVIRTSQLIPEMQEAFFQCQVCAHTARVEIDRGRIAEPSVCERCHTTHSMALIHNRSVFSDKQMVCAFLGALEGIPIGILVLRASGLGWDSSFFIASEHQVMIIYHVLMA